MVPSVQRFFTGSALGVVVEISGNWQTLRSWDGGLVPERRLVGGGAACEKPTSIFIKKSEQSNLISIRDWLSEQEIDKFDLFGRFDVDQKKYQTQYAFLGVTYRFIHPEEAAMFKLFCYRH